MNEYDFFFRGNRNYLHATTLFDHILNAVLTGEYEPRNIDFSIHKSTDKVCEFFTKGNNVQQKRIVAQYQDHRSHFNICETDKTIAKRKPYQEQDIIDRCILKGNEIIIPATIKDYTFIEKVIAAYRYVLTTLFQEARGRYMFARLVCEYIPRLELRVSHDRIISQRYFQGTITHTNEKIGSIFFGLHTS